MTDARERFQARFDVPRETMQRFDDYAALLVEWQARMNLVGPSTLAHVWDRHFTDSAQLLAPAGTGRSWLDVGAGGGFPGLIIATLDATAQLTLVESIAKKCRFLTEVAEKLALTGHVSIANRRVETLPRQKFDVITARALAPLAQIFAWCLPYAGSGTRWILPKGARVADELENAARSFAFTHQLVPSLTDPDARIVVASSVQRR